MHNDDDTDFKDNYWYQLIYMHCMTNVCRDDVRFAVPCASELYSIDRSSKFDYVLLASARAWCRVERPKQLRTLTERRTAGTQVVRITPHAPTTERLEIEQEVWHVKESQLTFLFLSSSICLQSYECQQSSQTSATLSGAPVTLESIASL